MKMDVITFYNSCFNENDRLSGNDNRHKIELLRKRFLYSKIIEELKPSNILQIACGTGIHTHWLCETYPDIEIYASDIVPEHVEQLNNYPNLHKRIWDCSEELPKEYNKFDLVLVEGAWYHLDWEKRKQLITNLKKLTPNVIVIDWLSAWHDTTQRVLQNKKMPDNITNPRPDEPFVFDTEADLEMLQHDWEPLGYSMLLFPVDMDLRFGYKDFNAVNSEEFKKFICTMNENIQIYGPEQTFIMNATEHGCYILKVN